MSLRTFLHQGCMNSQGDLAHFSRISTYSKFQLEASRLWPMVCIIVQCVCKGMYFGITLVSTCLILRENQHITCGPLPRASCGDRPPLQPLHKQSRMLDVCENGINIKNALTDKGSIFPKRNALLGCSCELCRNCKN